MVEWLCGQIAKLQAWIVGTDEKQKTLIEDFGLTSNHYKTTTHLSI
jgi:hypothetical protein